MNIADILKDFSKKSGIPIESLNQAVNNPSERLAGLLEKLGNMKRQIPPQQNTIKDKSTLLDYCKNVLNVKEIILKEVDEGIKEFSKRDFSSMDEVHHLGMEVQEELIVEPLKKPEEKISKGKQNGEGVEEKDISELKRHLIGRMLALKRENESLEEELLRVERLAEERKKELKVICESFKSSQGNYPGIMKMLKLREKKELLEFLKDMKDKIPQDFTKKLQLEKLTNNPKTQSGLLESEEENASSSNIEGSVILRKATK